MTIPPSSLSTAENTPPTTKRYSGRDFSPEDLALIRALIADNPTCNRADLSRMTCKALHWYKADGGLKEMSCRVAMLRMQDDGLIQLPAPTGERPSESDRIHRAHGAASGDRRASEPVGPAAILPGSGSSALPAVE